MRPPTDVPHYAGNLFAPDVLRDPHPAFAEVRELGPVVWLTRQRCYALGRFDECKAALLDAETFISGRGVGFNPAVNYFSRGTTIASDGDEHRRKRRALAHRLRPRALREFGVQVEAAADEVVADAVLRGSVDGAELARALPLSVVPDLIDWPRDRRDRLVGRGADTFDALGPAGSRMARAVPGSLAMLRFARSVVRERSVLPGSMGDDLRRAADDGDLERAECPALMIDYLAPSLDTTISATAGALHLFATHPGQWDTLRAAPSLIPGAVEEIVRHTSPLRLFRRTVARDVDVAGARLTEGATVAVLYAAANRDPRQWADPDAFDVRRSASSQIGFGWGAHGCAGQGLARMELSALLTALVRDVAEIRLTGEAVAAENNVVGGYATLPLELVPA